MDKDLSEELRNQLHTIIEESGYEGYDPSKNKYHIDGLPPTSSLNKVIKSMGLKERASKHKYYELALTLDSIGDEIEKVVHSIPFGDEDNYNKNSVGFIAKSSEVYMHLTENLHVFKTLVRFKDIDPVGYRSSSMSVLLYNKMERTVVNGSKYSIDAILELLETDRAKVLKSKNVHLAEAVFNPYSTEPLIELNNTSLYGVPITGINLYKPPAWRGITDKASYGGWIKQIIEHLIVDEQEREAVLDWMHFSIVSRNGTVLVLAGDRGTGKSTLAAMMAFLVGKEYTEYVSSALLTEKFNPQMDSSRLLIFEEVALRDADSVNKIKAWCNDTIAIEKKGENPFTAVNYSSMVFLLNQLEDFRISPSERRFSIPKVSEIDLKLVMPKDVIDYIQLGISKKTEEFSNDMAEFGNWLLHRKPKTDAQTPIRGEYYYKVSEMSLTMWQNEMIRYVIENGEVGVSLQFEDIFKALKDNPMTKAPTRRDAIDNFLRDYRHRGVAKVGVTVDLATAIVPQKGSMVKRKSKYTYGLLPTESFLTSFGAKYISKSAAEASIAEDIL